MSYFLVISLLVPASISTFGQAENQKNKKPRVSKLYFYWGWNGSFYSKSNIRFKGENYDFTLKKVLAKDRQSDFSFDTYLNPRNATIPQYNFRAGYFLKDNWDISFGIDHMKYVVQQGQTVNIDGVIEKADPLYDGIYSGQSIQITKDFLQFEHTDGLNYGNFELRHSDRLMTLKPLDISLIEGLGIGLLYPRTNTTLFGKERYDQFHLSGYGLGALIGLRVSIFNFLFIQSEIKGGFINLPQVRTTSSKTDGASHHFFFSQYNILLGGTFNLKAQKKK